MNAHRTLCHQIRHLIEDLVLKNHSGVDGDAARHLSLTKSAERCTCAPCLDIISRSHTKKAKELREHDHDLVYKWLREYQFKDDAAKDFPREVRLAGYAEGYLQRMDQAWWESERLLEHR